MDKLERLKNILRECQPLIVAYSGGVDSAFLLRAAIDAVGADAVLGVTAVSPSLAPSELEEAISLAKEMGAAHRLVETSELDDPEYVLNNPDRCYHCKKTLFNELNAIAQVDSYSTVVDGFNADDVGDWRPGEKAGRERGVRSPLKEASLSKSEIRHYSAQYGLPTADKPAMACLASRLPYGTKVTAERLEQVGRAEAIVKEQGFRNVRVRHHDRTARLEVAETEMAKIWDVSVQRHLVNALKELGYESVVLDLCGFVSGSMNTMLSSSSSDEQLTEISDPCDSLSEMGFDGVGLQFADTLVRITMTKSTRMRLSDASLRAQVRKILLRTGVKFVTVDLSDEPVASLELPQVFG